MTVREIAFLIIGLIAGAWLMMAVVVLAMERREKTDGPDRPDVPKIGEEEKTE